MSKKIQLTLSVSGDYNKSFKYLKTNKNLYKSLKRILFQCAEDGLIALKEATPKDTGLTSESWYYEITPKQIAWKNRNIVDGVNIAIILQYGHATRGGTYVTGVDYINPALRPIFDRYVKIISAKIKKGR